MITRGKRAFVNYLLPVDKFTSEDRLSEARAEVVDDEGDSDFVTRGSSLSSP